MNTKSLLLAAFLGLLACPLAGQDAERLYQQLCDDGDMLGCSLLGVMYRDGAGVTQNLARAAELFEQACDGDMMEGCGRLGVLYANGVGVTQDITRALDLSEQACEGGYTQGCSKFEALMGLLRSAVLGQLPTEDRILAAGVEGRGTLSDADSQGPDGSYVQAWALLLRAGEEVTAQLTSSDFDAYLILMGPALESELSDDDGGGGCDARITFTAPEDGEYRAIVGTSDPSGTGEFVLRASATAPAAASEACNRALAVGGPAVLAGRTGRTEAQGSSTLIVRADLEEYAGRSALDVIRQLNSRWLRATRGAGFAGPSFARVVIDGTPYGDGNAPSRSDFDELSGLSADNIDNIRFLTATDATTRYGTGYPGGVIEETTRR